VEESFVRGKTKMRLYEMDWLAERWRLTGEGSVAAGHAAEEQ
jgi:hypothetical protein